jgi:hypothetical protein
MKNSGVQTQVHTGYESDEALHKGDLGSDSSGIRRTHEIIVSSQDASGRDDEVNVDDFSHTR